MSMQTQPQVFSGTCYRIYGDPVTQPVLVLIHGVGLDQSLWTEWVTTLAPHYAVVTYDLLGHGQSANPSGERSLADFSSQLQQLLDYLEVAHFHLVGFSLGALVSLHFAATRAGRLRSVTLLHSVYQRTREQLDAIGKRYIMTRDEGPMATVEVAIQRWFSSRWIAQHPQVAESIRTVFRAHQDDGYLKAYGVFCGADTEIDRLDLSRVDCPSLTITGSFEPGSTPAMSQALGAALGGAVIINEGHLHMAPVEHAAMLIAQVQQFLEKS